MRCSRSRRGSKARSHESPVGCRDRHYAREESLGKGRKGLGAVKLSVADTVRSLDLPRYLSFCSYSPPQASAAVTLSFRQVPLYHHGRGYSLQSKSALDNNFKPSRANLQSQPNTIAILIAEQCNKEEQTYFTIKLALGTNFNSFNESPN